MNQSSMEYQDIIKKLKELTTVEDFAEGSFTAPADFIASPEIQELREKKDKAYKIYTDTPAGELRVKKYNDWKSIPYTTYQVNQEYLESIGFGPIEEVTRYGGEDMGSTWYSVKYFPKHDIYIRVDGWYQSYHGTEFGSWEEACSEVRPTTKQITVYE